MDLWPGSPHVSHRLARRAAPFVLGHSAMQECLPHPETASVASKNASLWCLDRFTVKAMLGNRNMAELKADVRMLGSLPLLAGLGKAWLMKIAQCLEPRSFAPGEYVVRQETSKSAQGTGLGESGTMMSSNGGVSGVGGVGGVGNTLTGAGVVSSSGGEPVTQPRRQPGLLLGAVDGGIDQGLWFLKAGECEVTKRVS